MTDPVIVVLSGEIDLLVREETAAAMTEAAENALAGCCDIVVDLAGVSFMDSVGLACLAQLSVLLRDRPNRIVLRAPGPAVVRVLELAGFGPMIEGD
jgi:anti-sigma B factor antagonist